MKEAINILLAEDEPSLGQILKENLEANGFKVRLCTNGKLAYEAFKEEQPNILVLDVMMPEKDGFSLAKDIRAEGYHTPILFLTAKSEVNDVVEGFQSGGNDYLRKPFSVVELTVRIKALLDRVKDVDRENIQIGAYWFNAVQQKLTHGSEEIALTHRESELLFSLYKHRNQVLERSSILKKLWGDDDFFNARSMDVFISKLRKKLNLDPEISILNIRGYGYKLVC